jgi:RNA polymerase subunit RPABC4/transcription elongation factor Spt4
MALIDCHECRTPISSTAKACPHCGAKKPYVLWQQNLLAIALVITVALLAYYISVTYG